MTRHSMAQEFLLMQSKHENPNQGFRPMKQAQCVCNFWHIPALHDLLGCPIMRSFSYHKTRGMHSEAREDEE